MNIQEVIDALERVKQELINSTYSDRYASVHDETKGGYFRVGNVCIKIAEVTELR